MSIEQISQVDAINVTKKSVEKWARHDIPQLDATNVTQHLLIMTQSEKVFDAFLMKLLQHLVSVTKSMGAVYYLQGEKQQLAVGPQLLSKELMSTMPDITGRIAEQAVPILKNGSAQNVDMSPFVVAIVPIKLSAQQQHILAAVYPEKSQHEPQLLANQLISSYVYLWQNYQENTQLNTESYFSSALLELMTLLQQAETKPEFESLLVNQLQTVLSCHQVAFGRFKDFGNQFQISAVSGTSEIDKRSHFKSLLDACAYEAKQFGKTVNLAKNSPATQDQSLLVSHRRLLEKVEAEYLISKILLNADGKYVGAVLCWWSKVPKDIQLKQQFIEAANQPLSSSVMYAASNQNQLFKTHKKNAWFRYKYWLIGLVTAIVLVFAFFPVEHKVMTNVSLEPVLQRIVSTRYDGVLKEILVEPGQQVQKGQVLALLDDQDLLIQQRALQAELDTAVKDRNLKIAAAEISAAQIASLDIQRITLELQLLQEQLNDLSIIAPIEGAMISEDIDHRQGSLLKRGEVLFELAPLQKMHAELMIPAEDITHVEIPTPVQIQFDALPKRQWQATLTNIQPRSVVIDSENVFVAKVPLNNDENLILKPGMRGQASIVAGQRSLGWVLFHKAAYRVMRWFSMTFTSPK